ncbi:MAG: MOMP family protein [Chlamydiia bacterium]|nr:MOMP family protein [Chlamydiia bacterium]
MKKLLGLLALSVTTLLCAASPSTPSSTTTLYFSDDESVTITPAAGPRIARSWNPFITADFIYWTVRQDGMFHAVSGVGPNVGKGSVHDLGWKTDPGFKVGLGCNLPHDGWDLFAEYTWIQSSASDSTSASNLISYWSINAVPASPLTHSHASWDIHFNDLHLELGRNSYLSQYLKLRIHVGLQGSWIDQDYNVHQTLTDASTARLSLNQDFWGIGLRAGLNTAWQFTHNFSFYGNLAAAILWGQFDLDRKDRATVNNVTTTNIHTGVNPHTFEPVLSLGAGLKWEIWFSQDRFHIAFTAGWEHQLWILQNEFIKVPTETDHIGDLVLQGLTIGGRLDF